MKKVSILIVFITELFSLTTYPDFSLCYEKYNKYSGTIPVSSEYSISFEKPINYFKYDEILQVYIIKNKNKNYIKFKNEPKLGIWISSIGENYIYVGNYAKSSFGLNKALSSSYSPKGSIVTDIFCNVYGVGAGDNKFITYKYIKYILQNNSFRNIYFELNDKCIITNKDFDKNRDFKIGDQILDVDNHKYNCSKISDYIIMGREDSVINVKVLRNGNILNLKAKFYKEEKEEINYLLPVGIITDNNLKITKILPDSIAQKHYVATSSQITNINGIEVKTLDDANKIMMISKDVTITLEQNGVSFKLKYVK
jgi:hypothetical protein